MVHFNIKLNIYHNTEKVLRLCGMLTVRVHAQIVAIYHFAQSNLYIGQVLLTDCQR